jgi:acetolactate synthase-1/2/3 large subunit
MKHNGAEILMNCLIEQNVDTVFGYPGGTVLDIYDALYKYSDKIKHYITSHEQGASHAADGYARATGKTGVVIATSGPGATNLVTGIATAYMDSVPLVAITGNVIAANLGRDSFQEIDITGVTMPITKHNYIVKDINELADTIREAFYIANSGRKGPVLIDITKNLQVAVTDYEYKEPKKYLAKPVKTEDVTNIKKIIEESKKPLILSGGGIVSSEASESLVKFAEIIDAPVSCTLLGLGGYSASSKRFLGMIGHHGTYASAKAYGECDLIIAIGMRFSDRVALNRDKFAGSKKIVHIDIDTAEINKNIKATASITADANEFLKTINSVLVKKERTEWMDRIAVFKQKDIKTDNIMAYKILTTIAELTDDNQIITTDVGQHQMWTAQHYSFEKPRTLLTSGGLGTMGFGLGAAIGASIGKGERIVLITGDGCFHMNLNELATAAKYNVPVIVFLMNNNALGMVRQWQKMFYKGRYSQTTLDKKTDYVALAKAFGCEGLTISSVDEIKPVIEKAFSLNSPVVIDCKIYIDDNVLPMIPSGKTFDEIITDYKEV